MLRQPLLLWSGCLSILFFNWDTLVSDLRDAMPRQSSLYTNPTPRCDFPGSLTGRNATPEVTDRIAREVEEFPRGDKHFKHVPPPTWLIYLSPKDLYRIVCSLRDLNPFYENFSMLKVFCFNRLTIELDD